MSDSALDNAPVSVPTARPTDDAWSDDEVLDQALTLVAEEHRALGALLGRVEEPPSLAELRRSPLGRDLRLLAEAGRTGDPAGALAAVRRVEGALLRPVAADGYAVPTWFRGTALGRLLAKAERAAHGDAGLLAPAEAAARLGVPAAAVEGWLAEGALGGVPAEGGGVLVPVAEVERRRAVARGLAGSAGDVVIAERSLAS